jgi:eukaryotic-like serine/threonine-protein kinase
MSQQKFGRYIIKGTLGRGAMGMVYLALDPILDRLSAIKVMNTGGEVDEGLRTRFFREAKSAARLRHPNIIAIYEMGEEGKKPFIAMEYVEGEDLKSLIEKRTFIPFEQKIRILVQVCEALSYAHQQGVIHRDIKPANVRIAQDGEVRILDFGLARLGSSDITRTGMLMGTPYYMSPEQVRGARDLDGRSDLFSVAVLLYELLAYARPFEAESSTEVCLKIVSEPHTPLASLLPRIDADLEGIIDRALSKSREARQPDCQALARALKEYVAGVPQKVKELEAEVSRLENEWTSCCDAAQHLVQLGIFEESLLASPNLVPARPFDPEETTVYNFSAEASKRDFGALLLTHARLQSRLEEVRQRLRAAVPLQELFERAQQQLKQGGFEDCLRAVAEILEMAPQNARALDMQRECQRLLEERRVQEERRARLKQALAVASEALEQGNLAQCIQAASRALQIEPGNSQAQELKQQASDTLVRRRRVAELLAAARGFHKSQNYESACQVCAEGLALDPGQTELRQIQQQSQQILTRQKQIREWLVQAQEKLLAGDYLAVLGTTDQLLTLEPDLPRAHELQQQAAEALERQLKLEELVAEARGCEMAGDFEECLRVCDQALQIGPENPEILELSKRASQTLALQRRVAELLSRARQEIERGEFALAAETCRTAGTLEPGNRAAHELLQTAEAGHQRQQRVAELLALAHSQQAKHDFQGCLDATSEALALDPVHPGHLELRRLAVESLKRARQLEEHLGAARHCNGAEDYAHALEHLERALELDGSHADALELKQLVAIKLDRHNQLNACLESARRHLQGEDYSGCLGSAQRALQLDADNAEARALCSQATEALARLERENRLLAQAHRHLEEQQYELAIEGAEELLRLNPQHAAARAFKQGAIDTQERRQRFEACLVAARNHAKSLDYSACLAAATEALATEPQHAELRRLQEKAVQALEKERAIAAGLERCRQCLATEDHASALEAADEVLRLEPKHREALTLQKQAAEGIENQQRFEELLVLARNHSKTQDNAACLKAADEALAFKPEHAELRKLREKSFQALERLRAIDAGLARARQALAEDRFPEAQAAAQSVLTLEPQHAVASDLARAADEGWQQQQRMEQLVEEARKKLEQRDYSAALAAAEEGLGLKSNHAALLELQKTLKQAVARQQGVARWVETARKQLEVRNYAGAMESCDQCLELEADHAEAWKLHQAASEGMERRQKVEDLQATAKGYHTAKDYEACLKAVEEALRLEPEDKELQGLQQAAWQALEKEQRLAALLENAQRSFQEQRFADAVGVLNELLSADPSHAAAARLKENASREWQKAQQLAQLLGEARQQASDGKWEACRKTAQEGLKLVPNHPEFQQIQDRAQLELAKLKRLAELLKKARAAFEESQYEEVTPLVAEMLAADPGHQEASDLRGKAVAALERQRQIRELLQAAQAHQAAQEPEPALQKAGEGLRLDARNAAFLSIQRWAAGALEHQKRVAALLHEAEQQASAGNWDLCRKKAQEGLKLAPDSEELQQIHDRAQRELEKQKQIAGLLRNCRALVQAGQFDDVLPLTSQILELEPSHPEASELKQKASLALERQRQMRELLEAAQAHEHAGELESALEKARAGLQLEGRHAQFLSIQSRTAAALEHRRRVSALLSEARQQLNNQQYEACLRASEELLKLEREHSEGHELKQAAAAALERLRLLNQCLAQAKAKAKAGLWEECLRFATEGLRFDSSHAELTELASQASEILDKRRTLQELLDSGHGQLARGEDGAALKSAERALQLAPDNAEAAQLKQQAQSALDARRKKEQVAALLAEAQKHEQSGEVEACYRTASEGLKLEPEHVELKALREKSGEILERQRQIQVLLELARQQWQAGDFPKVVETAASALQLDPKNAKAADFKLKAEQELGRRQRLKELLSQAKQADKEKNHEACLRAVEEGLALESSHAELQRLRDRSQQMIEQTRRMAQLLQEARSEIEARNYAAALKALDSALKLEGANAEAAQLKQKAQEAWERQKRLEGLLNDAQRQLKAGQFEACLESAGQGLALEADHALFKELAAEAQRQLELRRRIEEGLKRAAQHFEKREYPAAVEVFDFVLKLAPGQAEAAEGRRRAQEALQRQQRLEECLAQAQAAFEAKDFNGCHAAAQEGLKLEPGHSVLQRLAAQAGEIIERARRVQQLWNEASQSQQKGDLPGCLRSLDLLLELEPENAAARDLRPKVVEALERQRRVAGLLAEAASVEKSGDLETCQRLAEQALQIDPQHSQARQFHQRISAALERRQQTQKLLEQAAQRFKDEDDAGALKAVEELLKLDPAQPRGLEIQSLATKRLEHSKRVEELLLQARQAQGAHEPDRCLRAAEQGLQLEPGHAEFKKLAAQSREQLERQRKIRELVSECQRQLSAGALEACIAAARSLESLDPGNTIAAETRQHANQGLERRRRVQGLLARALDASAAGDVEVCHRVCIEALEIDPSNAELLKLRDQAFKVLESRRREEERQRRMQQLLASAKASLQGGRFRAARRDLVALLELDAAHAEARRLLAESETQLAAARQKSFQFAKLAAAAVLAVSLLGSGVWYAMQLFKQAPSDPASQSNPGPAPPNQPPPETTPPPPIIVPSEDPEVARLLEAARGLLRQRRYSEAKEAAEKLLGRSPNHAEGEKVRREAQKSSEAIDSGLQQARALFDRGRYGEVASVLGTVLALDAHQPDAIQLMAQVDKYARGNAQDAQKQMLEIKQRAAQAGAPSLVQHQYQTASAFESDAIQLFERKRFGEATGKFYEASEAYVRAEADARARTADLAREAAREKAAKDKELATKAADRQQEERERQIALQRNQAQSAWNEYLKALPRASQAGAERLAPDLFQQATSLGMRAQEKFNQGNYGGAQTDFGEALRQLVNAIGRAEETAQQRRQNEERQQKEVVQRAEDVRAIQQVLRNYQGAIENKDADALRRVWPSIPRKKEEEMKVFKDSKSIRVELELLGEPRFLEDSAVVTCRKIQRVVFSNGQRFDPRFESKMTLRRSSGGWLIESIEDVVQSR